MSTAVDNPKRASWPPPVPLNTLRGGPCFYYADADGVLGWHDEPPPHKRTQTNGNPWSQPLESLALGCHSSQVPEFRDRARDAGLTGVDFTPDGTALLSSRGQRKQYAKLRGMRDNDGGYGD